MINYPKVATDKKGNVFVCFKHNQKRYRLYNGSKIGIELKPNTFPINERFSVGKLLAAEVFKYFQLHNKLISNQIQNVKPKLSDIEYIKKAYLNKKNSNCSEKYCQTLKAIYSDLKTVNKREGISYNSLKNYLESYSNPTTFNTMKAHLNVLLNEAVNEGMEENPIKEIKKRKGVAKLHKPFKDILLVLNDIKDFHTHLYLCCLLTYGCLLRPHREIRELKWSDFSPELDYINLSGARNKSKKNRIVPVPEFVKNALSSTLLSHNIFSDNTKPFNPSYFKTLWGRYKKQSTILEDNQTLYSFRHAGAIDIFKRTGSLHKLQRAMGHSSLIVTTTYLRGLEVCELTKEDMPVL